MEPASFHWSDYVTFGAMLLVSAVIGVTFGRKNEAKSAGGLFVGNRKMTLLPVTMSTFATFMCAVSILGGPLEVYYNGVTYCYIDLVALVGTIVTCFVFIPFFYRLGYVSIFEYMRLRFNATVSTMAAVLSQLGLFLYMSVVLYAPSSAFSQMSGLALWITIPCVGIVCTLYTAFGGLQGVMWTDVWQSAFMFAGLVAILIVGTINVGGADQVVEAARQGGRLSFAIDTTFDPFIRHSVLSVIIGGSFFISTAISSQPLYQRYISCKTLKTAQLATWLSHLVNIVFAVLIYGTGLVAFAYFTCDPLLSGEITKPEHLIPYMVMKTMAIPGITGLFLACCFSGALSTISSCLNSICMVTIVDFIGPIRRSFGKAELSDRTTANLSKLIATVLGAMMVALALLCEKINALIAQITMSIGGMSEGPIFGVVLSGLFLPFVNSTGAICGFVVSAIFSILVGVGSAASGITSYSPKLPLSDHGCPADLNATDAANYTASTISWYFTEAINSTGDLQQDNPAISASVTAEPISESLGIAEILRLSYLLYSLTSTIIYMVVAISVSLCTKCNKNCPVPPHLIYWTRRKGDSEKSGQSSKMPDFDDDSSSHLNSQGSA